MNLGDTKDKTAAEKLQGYWILEIGELAGLKKAEVETLRSFLSRQNDIYRAAFGKRATPHLRQCRVLWHHQRRVRLSARHHRQPPLLAGQDPRQRKEAVLESDP